MHCRPAQLAKDKSLQLWVSYVPWHPPLQDTGKSQHPSVVWPGHLCLPLRDEGKSRHPLVAVRDLTLGAAGRVTVTDNLTINHLMSVTTAGKGIVNSTLKLHED